MVAQSASLGVKTDRLKTIVFSVFHVLPIVASGALDEGGGVQNAQAPLPKCFRLPDHLPVEVWMKTIASTIPWHDQDDVPNVGSRGQLDQVVQRAEVSVHALLHEAVGRVTTLLGVASHLLI